MDNNIKYGSSVRGGQFKCNDCGEVMIIKAHQVMPPCPYYNEVTHTKKSWREITGQNDIKDRIYP